MAKTLNDLFLEELSDMYDAEHRIIKALPDLIKTATCTDLKAALEKHLRETQGQVTKLERVFESFDEKPRSKKCPAMTGLLDEGDDIASTHKKSPTVNAAVISAAQKVEHYEIASYGCLRAWAIQLGNPEASSLLNQILVEEKSANEALNRLAVVKNQEALEGTGSDTGAGYETVGRHGRHVASGLRDDE